MQAVGRRRRWRLSGGCYHGPQHAFYSPWADKILTPAETQNLLYTFRAQGTVQSWNLGITPPEEVRVIPANENLFVVDFTNRLVWGSRCGPVREHRRGHRNSGGDRIR